MNHLHRKIALSSTIVLTLAAVVLLASLSMQAQPQEQTGGPAPAPPGNAANGKKLYNVIGCWQCHGFSAQGGSAGPKLIPDPISYPAFTEYIRAPKGEMPIYTTKVLSDAQLADIYAFLKTIPPPRKMKDIPLLNQKGE